MDIESGQIMVTKDLVFNHTVKSLDADTGRFAGGANMLNRKDLDSEMFVSGAFRRWTEFRKSLGRDTTVPVFYGHDYDQPAGFAKVWEAANELQFDGHLDQNLPGGQKAYHYAKSALGHGFPPGISVGVVPYPGGIEFLPDPGNDIYNPANPPKSSTKIRAFTSVALNEISVVPFPCSVGSQVISLKRRGYLAESAEEKVDYSRLYRAMEVPSGHESTDEEELDLTPLLRSLALPDDKLSMKQWMEAREALSQIHGDNARSQVKKIISQSPLTLGKRMEMLDLARDIWAGSNSVGEVKTMDDLARHIKRVIDDMRMAA